MNTSQQLLSMIHLVRGPAVVVKDRALLLQAFARIHSIIIASENLLDVAATQAKDSELAIYFLDHLKEETGHAQWLAEDLAAAGVKPIPPSAIVMEIVGSIYFMIFHIHPAALLGYMLVMESSPLSGAQLEELENIHGHSLVRTLRHHVENDPAHLSRLCEMIDKSDQPDVICSAASKALLLLKAMS